MELKTVGLKSEVLNPPVFNKYALAIPAIDTVAARCIELKLAEPQYNELTELMADEGLTGESIENKGILEAIVRKIDDRDCVLISNYKKKGVSDYIGGNTFLEIGYAYGLGKKIFILNNLPQTSVFKEEILGMQPIVLKGNLEAIR